MDVREAVEADKEVWNEFVLGSPAGSFLQSWEWGEVQERFGGKIWRFLLEVDGKIEAAALVLRRDLPMGRSWLYVPRGPMMRDYGADNKVFLALQKTLDELGEEEGAVFVRIDPALAEDLADAASFVETAAAAGWRKAEREVQPRNTLVLDLTKPEEELLAEMKSKTRYNVRLAERKGVAVRFSQGADDVKIFLELAREVNGRSGFAYHPDEYYRAIIEVLGAAGMAELGIAGYEGQALAAHLMIYADGMATYAHGASSDAKRKLMAPQYLYWQTIRRAKERGMRKFDFFGVAPQSPAIGGTAGQAPHPWAGVTRIKEGFGGERVDYIGAYDLVLDDPMYTAFNVVRRVKSLLR